MKLEEAIDTFAEIIAEKVAERVKNLIPAAKEAGECERRSLPLTERRTVSTPG
jgi:hypothetical protein